MFFRPATPDQVRGLCRELDPSKGPGFDGVAPAMVRFISDPISVPLSRLINACIQAGYFPDFWKIARVVPIFKADDPTCFGNYRPVSVLPVFSKIFERIIQERLLSFLNSQDYLFNGQYGFRRGHSTSMAIIDLVENIKNAWERREHCLGVFIDFSKAFDTVDHEILIAKLDHYGVRGPPKNLIESYLSNRKQYVSYDGRESSHFDVTVGVRQGSIFGQLFLILYVNDLARSSPLFKYILFADDTNLFASGKTKRALYKKVRAELGVLSQWFACNKLSLNYKKTEFIDFSKPRVGSSSHNFTLNINGHRIKKVKKSKFLGVTIDEALSWREHIGMILRKVRQTIGVIGRARGFMGGPQLLGLYNTMDQWSFPTFSTVW